VCGHRHQSRDSFHLLSVSCFNDKEIGKNRWPAQPSGREVWTRPSLPQTGTGSATAWRRLAVERNCELTCVVLSCPSIFPDGPGKLSKLDCVAKLNNTSHDDSIATRGAGQSILWAFAGRINSEEAGRGRVPVNVPRVHKSRKASHGRGQGRGKQQMPP
jgi:hypothetical protein